MVIVPKRWAMMKVVRQAANEGVRIGPAGGFLDFRIARVFPPDSDKLDARSPINPVFPAEYSPLASFRNSYTIELLGPGII